jgi:hypothetical protein
MYFFLLGTLVEEKEDDDESVDSVLSRGRGGRSSRASSEDRSSSSRGSSVHRNTGPSKTFKDEDLFNNEQKYASIININSFKK